MHNDAMPSPKNDARTFCEKLSAFLDGEVPPEVLCEIVEHVRNCDGPCRHVHDDIVALTECCREQAENLEKVPRRYHEGLMSLIRDEIRS